MKKLVFRIPATALLAAGLIAICVTPVAWVAPGLQALYVLPLGYAYWILRNRTTVTEDTLVARGVFGSTTLKWSEVKSIRLVRKGWLKAVKEDDTEVTLPAVRFMHLPALSLVSGGRVPDPTIKEVPEAVAEDVTEDAADEVAEEVVEESVQSEK
ncbi:PH domain-containing protein [Lentzea sp. BCCO 10_0856]|uniref:PH domain-containing protein n=1 Tax=Lentzea miocenica TaxID=3095431 RepID=A0ABU4SXY4_9PSEU|nr:PH domain-containing protein [Lentzea sp. BCCO 10_0856]MDX8030766.1 PH domain-containing protein [Lentzea sp. BCCO 10_0856]